MKTSANHALTAMLLFIVIFVASSTAVFADCSPTTCSAQGRTCGALADGCGGVLNCGVCPSGQICKDGSCVQSQVFCNEDPGCSPSRECTGSGDLLLRSTNSTGGCVNQTIDCPEGCLSITTPRCACSPSNTCANSTTLITRTQTPEGGCEISQSTCPFGCSGGVCNNPPSCTESTRCEGTVFINRTNDSSLGCTERSTDCAPGACAASGCACQQSRCEGNDLVQVDPQDCDETRTNCAGGCVSSPSPHCGTCTPDATCSASGLQLITVRADCQTEIAQCPGGCESLPGDDRCRTCNPSRSCQGDLAITIRSDCSRSTAQCPNGCAGGQCNRDDDGCILADIPRQCVGSIAFARTRCVEEEFDCRSAGQECVDGECVEEPKNCRDCGGIFGGLACDYAECHTLGTCYFAPAGNPETGQKCDSCGTLRDCTSYGSGQTDCLGNPCGYQPFGIPDPCNFCGLSCIEDFDKDCVPNAEDNCWFVSNSDQKDSDERCVLKPNPPYVVDPACGDACQPLVPGQNPSDGTIILSVNQSLVRQEVPVYLDIPDQPSPAETINMVVYTIG